jgi:hypothetical protein
VSRYDLIWNEIKKHGYVELTVTKASARPVLNGIKRIKTAENVARRLAGLVGWSKLVITQTELSSTHLRIRLELLYRTDL